ncbi:MAG: MarR family transcriptional regulator [Chloroflexi bacterium]|nr:MarR family transcriptional regulator [Chloroflexota bacterium]
MSEPESRQTIDDECAERFLRVVPQVLRLLAWQAREDVPAERLTLPQFKILSRLVEGQCLPSELARSFDVSLPTMTVTVDTLVRRGMVDRRPHPDDRRMVRLAVTSQGRSALARFRERAVARLAKVISRLESREKLQLLAAFEALHRALAGTAPVRTSGDGCEEGQID